MVDRLIDEDLKNARQIIDNLSRGEAKQYLHLLRNTDNATLLMEEKRKMVVNALEEKLHGGETMNRKNKIFAVGLTLGLGTFITGYMGCPSEEEVAKPQIRWQQPVYSETCVTVREAEESTRDLMFGYCEVPLAQCERYDERCNSRMQETGGRLRFGYMVYANNGSTIEMENQIYLQNQQDLNDVDRVRLDGLEYNLERESDDIYHDVSKKWIEHCSQIDCVSLIQNWREYRRYGISAGEIRNKL